MQRKYTFLLFLIIVTIACNSIKELPEPATHTGWKVKEMPAYTQTQGGDPEAGYAYLIYGDYIGSGIPMELFKKRIEKLGKDTLLKRTGVNENIDYTLTAFKAKNGQMVVNGNCLTCHAGALHGEIVIGLGNSFSDFQFDLRPLSRAMNMGMKLKYGKDSEEWEAFEDFQHYFEASAPYVKTNQPGANPAAMLAEACVMYRDPMDLSYRETANFDMPRYAIATDVPPLWNLKKKNVLYYTAVGRGDFTKLLFQASVLGIPDTTAARKAITNFKDVIAWIKTLEPPKYPGTIDETKAAQGEALFEKHCASCHGTYGENESYPNKVVSLDLIKTDPLYASYAIQAPIVDWYNKSWFAVTEPTSFFEPEPGYIAPPLDGIWATAPYFHNGAVPTLMDVLNSYDRPTYWQRSGDSKDYDLEKVGWKYERAKNGKGKWTFDTTLPGYGNDGHYFGDHLTGAEREAVVEYLKGV